MEVLLCQLHHHINAHNDTESDSILTYHLLMDNFHLFSCFSHHINLSIVTSALYNVELKQILDSLRYLLSYTSI